MTEDDTVRILKRQPISQELIDSIFKGQNKPSNFLSEQDIIDTVHALHAHYYTVWEYYKDVHIFFGDAIPNERDSDMIVRMEKTERQLYPNTKQ